MKSDSAAKVKMASLEELLGMGNPQTERGGQAVEACGGGAVLSAGRGSGRAAGADGGAVCDTVARTGKTAQGA